MGSVLWVYNDWHSYVLLNNLVLIGLLMNNIQSNSIVLKFFKIKTVGVLFIPAFLIMLFLSVSAEKIKAAEVKSQDPDLHKLWDSKCVTCHGHSGEFSRKFLKIVDGQLKGRLFENDLRLFLHNHYLAGKEVDSIYAMLLAQASVVPRFKQECSGCHQKAAEFVRKSLILKDSVLYSNKLKTPVSHFLVTHRGLTVEDIEFFIKQLTRVASEVYRNTSATQ